MLPSKQTALRSCRAQVGAPTFRHQPPAVQALVERCVEVADCMQPAQLAACVRACAQLAVEPEGPLVYDVLLGQVRVRGCAMAVDGPVVLQRRQAGG